MNGNIQVEPTRVKLDKQGATTFLTKVTTVDAIVRPLLTKHTILAKQYQSISGVVLLQQEKVLKKIWGWGSGPPLLESFPVLPPPRHMGGFVQGRGELPRGQRGGTRHFRPLQIRAKMAKQDANPHG